MSTENRNEFDDFLKSKTDGFRLNPRPMVFHKISSSVSKYQTAKVVMSIAVFAFLIGSLYVIEFSHLSKATSPIIQQSKTNKNENIDAPKNVLNNHSNRSSIQPPIIPIQFTPKTIVKSFEPVIPTSHTVENIKPLDDELMVNNLHLSAFSQSPVSLEAPKPQPAAQPHKHKNPWVLSVFASTGYSFRSLEYDHDFKKNPHSFTNQNGFDWRHHRAIVGFSVGVSAEKMVCKNWYIKTGLQSYIGGYDIKNEFTTYQAPLNMSAKANEKLEVVNSRYRMAYIETPFLVGMKKSFRHIDLKVDGGLTLSARLFEVIPENAGLLGKEYAVWNGNSKLLNATVQITPSVSYKLGQWKMNTGVEWRYQLTSTYKASYPVREHLYYLGLKTGINI